MSTHKTVVNQDKVLAFLDETFSSEILNFEIIKGGEGSQAFGFSTLDDQYIIRVNKNSVEGFKKDEYASLNFTSTTLPVPEVTKTGKINDGLYFCISKRTVGKTMDAYTDEEKKALAPEVFKTLDVIHATDVSHTEGYGEWNSQGGSAISKSWKKHLSVVDHRVERLDGSPGLCETSFLEKDVCNTISHKIAELIKFCPEERYLLHADCGFDNILSDGKKITGVIDWENSMYGDFLYDLAWISFWESEIKYEKMYLEYSKDNGLHIDHFNERVLCYKLAIGLNALIFFSYSNQKDKYEYTKKILKKLL